MTEQRLVLDYAGLGPKFAVMDHLDQLEAQSATYPAQAFNRIDKLGMLWSLGKRTAMSWSGWRARPFSAMMPFPVMHIDTERRFPEMYVFRETYCERMGPQPDRWNCARQWKPRTRRLPKNARSAARKTLRLRDTIAKYGFTGVIAGIRRDEESVRAKERVFSPRGESGAWDFRDQPPEFWDYFNTDLPAGTHLRVHPLLSWTELDIWKYIEREGIPMVDLYFAKNGQRYRSLGDQDITFPVKSDAATIAEIIAELETTRTSERAGRAMDRETEDAFERLRAAGYM